MDSTQMELSAQEQRFIEDWGLLMADSGLPRSVGRALGFLLICEPAQQSSEEVQRMLHLSSGSVSGAMSFLTKIQLVERVSFAGDRKLYYRLQPECWQRILQGRILQAQRGLNLAEEGLAMHAGNTRLQGMHGLYVQSVEAMDRIKL